MRGRLLRLERAVKAHYIWIPLPDGTRARFPRPPRAKRS